MNTIERRADGVRTRARQKQTNESRRPEREKEKRMNKKESRIDQTIEPLSSTTKIDSSFDEK